MWKWINRVFLVVAILLFSGASYQFISTKLDEINYPPPGKLVDVGGYKLHINVSGSGGPTVVLDAGMGCNCLDWSLVQPEIAQFTRVCSYDRAGYGWSDASPLERTSENIVEELHTLLVNAGIEGPYLLVGHSFGGVNVRLFALKYPEEVAGIILVDASHEDQFEKIPAWPFGLLETVLADSNIAPFLASVGVARLLNYLPRYQQFYQAFPLEIRQKYVAATSTTKFITSVTQEFSKFPQSLNQLKKDKRALNNYPWIVITAGKLLNYEETGYRVDFIEMFKNVWQSLQKDLVEQSTKGKHLIAEKSGHMVTHEQPEIIINAIQEMFTVPSS